MFGNGFQNENNKQALGRGWMHS